MDTWEPSETDSGQGALPEPLGAGWSSGPGGGTGSYARRYTGGRGLGRRLGGLAAVVLLHVGVIYVVVSGLGRQVVDVIRAPLVTKIIEAPPPPPAAPAPPKLQEPPPPYIPPPEIDIQQPQGSNAIQVTTAVKPKTPAPTRQVPDSEVSEQAISGPALQYPPPMVALGIEGSADIECTVDVDGSTSDCKVDAVAGNSSFGDEALKHAENARFKPAVRNGVAIKSRHRWHVVFRLNG